jgi:general secretion pathway protein M
MNRWREIIVAYWQARTQRERTILLGSALLLALMLLNLGVVSPAIEGRAAWKKNLPALRAQQAQMQILLAKLKATPVTAATAKNIPPVSRKFIESSLTAKGLKPDSLSVNGDMVILQLTNHSFSSLIGWLQEMQSSAQLRVTEANVSAQQQADRVDVTLSLRQAS